MDFKGLLAEAVSLGASDLHWSSGEPPVLRINGELERCINGPIVSFDGLIQQVRVCLPEPQLAALDTQPEIDCAFSCDSWEEESGIEPSRFRLHMYRHSQGIALAVRILPLAVPQLGSLGLPQFVTTLPECNQGLVLVTGPTGSGKSTTLAAILDHINRNQAVHVVTIEDPIEFVHVSRRAVIRQREVGVHSASFASALRAGLREDPDVIMVGELRDLETIQLALTAAETGHVVFATLHASGAAKTIDRVIDVFPAEQQAQVRSMLAESLRAVVSQRLVRTSTGLRVPNVEIAAGTPAVRTLIREAKTHQLPGVLQVSRGVGMCTFEMHRQELGI